MNQLGESRSTLGHEREHRGKSNIHLERKVQRREGLKVLDLEEGGISERGGVCLTRNKSSGREEQRGGGGQKQKREGFRAIR